MWQVEHPGGIQAPTGRLLEREDMGMMRPFVVMPAQVLKFDHGGAHGGHGEGRPG